MKSIEEKVEDYYKSELRKLKVRCFSKTETVNKQIDDALKKAPSKDDGPGGNTPDIKVLLSNEYGRVIPVMFEAKGTKDCLEKFVKGEKTIDETKPAVKKYAVNGALHYGRAVLDYSDYKEVIIVGVNGFETDSAGNVINPEIKAYYVSKKNKGVPKLLTSIDTSLKMFKQDNVDKLFKELDELNLTEAELETLSKKAEEKLEAKIKKIHQAIYDDKSIKNELDTNQKLYLFCGLIMAGLKTQGVAPLEVDDLKGNDSEDKNDGTIICEQIKTFLNGKHSTKDKTEQVLSLLEPVFKTKALWKATNGESLIKTVFREIKEDIIPLLESDYHLDFTGRILNSLNDWTQIDNDKQNDVVLTPRSVTNLMAKLARTDKDSWVWDWAMGSAGFLVSAMDLMLKDAKNKIKDKEELEEKIKHIKEKQILGIEILPNIYILAVLNMILMGDGSSNIMKGNSHEYNGGFQATVFLLNPPYSADGKGFNFVEEALSKMTQGYACILIQENAGSGQGLPYTKRILKNNTLIASIHMPDKLFNGKASVQTAIYVFKVNTPHDKDNIVKFIDFSNDGYSRQNRKKSTQEVNLRDTDDATGRYKEVEDIVLGKKPKTNYYTKENGLYIEDTISLEGNDWCFTQHKEIDTMPTEADFKKVVADYLSWKVSTILKGNE